MVTVLNNPSPSVDRSTMIERTEDGGAGWAVAIIILLAVVAVGGFLWLRYYRAPAATPGGPGTSNINVTLPGSQSTPAPNTQNVNVGPTRTPTPAPTP